MSPVRRFPFCLALAPALCLALLSGCGSKAPSVQYIEVASQAGVTFRHTDGSAGGYFIAETLASGVGLFDYDADGDLDVYFVNGRPLPPGAAPAPWARDCTPRNALYRNDGVGPDGIPRLVDVTEKTGVPGTGFGVGVCVGDYNGDGFLDFFVAQLEIDALYRNNGDGTFKEVAKEAGIIDPLYGSCAAFGDIDNDGWLDLYIANYTAEDFYKPAPCLTNNIRHYCAPKTYQEVPHSLFHNKGDGTFQNISETSGIRKPYPGQGLGVTFCDLDDDGYIDIYVANDGSENFLFHNLKNRTFENIGLRAGVAYDMNGDEQGSMGVDICDVDEDGRWDIVVTAYQKQHNAFYHNEGNMAFTDIGVTSGISANALPFVKWGTKFIDYDNDGILDLFVACGHLEERIEEYDQSSTYLQQNQLFKGMGNLKFKEVTSEAGPGLLPKHSCRGAAFGDIDNDGDTDVALCCSKEKPLILLNQGGNRAGNWVQLQLTGAKPNIFAIGARVTVWAGKHRFIQEVRSGGSYASQNDLRLHFGLGSQKVDKVEIRWPDGKTEAIAGVELNRLNKVVQGRGIAENGAKVAAR